MLVTEAQSQRTKLRFPPKIWRQALRIGLNYVKGFGITVIERVIQASANASSFPSAWLSILF